eukprot:6478943-Amphidinium_carterae.1
MSLNDIFVFLGNMAGVMCQIELQSDYIFPSTLSVTRPLSRTHTTDIPDLVDIAENHAHMTARCQINMNKRASDLVFV